MNHRMDAVGDDEEGVGLDAVGEGEAGVGLVPEEPFALNGELTIRSLGTERAGGVDGVAALVTQAVRGFHLHLGGAGLEEGLDFAPGDDILLVPLPLRAGALQEGLNLLVMRREVVAEDDLEVG